MDEAPAAWHPQPPWASGRPRRSAAERRAQALRAEGRVCQRLLKAFAALQGHRGGWPMQLGEALDTALKDNSKAVVPHRASVVETAVQPAQPEAFVKAVQTAPPERTEVELSTSHKEEPLCTGTTPKEESDEPTALVVAETAVETAQPQQEAQSNADDVDTALGLYPPSRWMSPLMRTCLEKRTCPLRWITPHKVKDSPLATQKLRAAPQLAQCTS